MPRKKKQPILEEVEPKNVTAIEEVEQDVPEEPDQEPEMEMKDVEDEPIDDSKPEKEEELEPPSEDDFDEEAAKRLFNKEDDSEKNEAEDREESIRRMGIAVNLFNLAKDARRKYDRDWLARDLFRRGMQFVSQDASNGTVSMTTQNKARIPVNLTAAYIRSIKNQVTSFKPKWEVLPEFKGRRAEADARLSGKLLDYIFFVTNLAKKIKEAVIQGLIYSVGGPFEIIWNPTFDNGPNQPKGQIEIILHDPYDIYIDPDAVELADANFIVKAVRTATSEIKNNPLYKKHVREMLSGGSAKKAESEYKQFLIQTLQSGAQTSMDNEGVILKEIQMKERTPDGGIKIRYLTWVDEVPEPLRDELMDQEDYDMEIFQADMNPLELYGESWSKHVIALNRVINALESSVFEYNYRYAKGRLVIDKNSGVRMVTNEHGSIIEKNRGAEVKPLPLQPLPSSVESQIMRLKNNMEDISGVHDASLGRAPTSIKSGIGIAELKQSDASNQDDLVQNLEECLMRLGLKVLKKIAKHYDTPRIIRVVGTGRVVEHFAAVGAQWVDEDKEEWKRGKEKYPLARVAESNELQVQIGSWLAYSKEAQQEMIMKLAEAGILSQEQVLKFLEFPNIQDIMDQTRSEKLIELKRKEVQEMPSGVSEEMLAREENEMLTEGMPMPVDPADDHELHIAIHTQALADGNDNNDIIQGHIKEHRIAQKGGGAPIKPEPVMEQPPMGQPPQLPPQMPMQPPMQTPLPPQMDPNMIPMPLPPGMPIPGALPPQPTPPPVQASFSAGIQELPPTAGGILGGANSPIVL